LLLLGDEQLARAFFGPRREPVRLGGRAGFRAQTHEELVARDAEKKSLEVGAALEVSDRFDASEERALHEIVHVSGRSLAEKGVKSRRVMAQEKAARSSVAGAPLFEQPRFRRVAVLHLAPPRSTIRFYRRDEIKSSWVVRDLPA